MTRPIRVEQSYSFGKLASHNTAVWKAAIGPGSCLAKVPVRYTGMRPPARIMATCRAESQCDVRMAALRVRLRGLDVAGVVQPLRQRLSGQPVTDVDARSRGRSANWVPTVCVDGDGGDDAQPGGEPDRVGYLVGARDGSASGRLGMSTGVLLAAAVRTVSVVGKTAARRKRASWTGFRIHRCGLRSQRLSVEARRRTRATTANRRNAIGNGRAEYQLTRRWAKIAQTKNSTSPMAAATPMNGMAMPAIKPTAPANFSAPSGSNHDDETSTLATLATACFARRKSNEAAQMFIAAATTATATYPMNIATLPFLRSAFDHGPGAGTTEHWSPLARLTRH